jgi:hypothetical protein
MAIVLKTPATLKPARSVTPLSTPRLRKSGLAKTTLAPAVTDLQTLFPAKSDAAYSGYEKGM